MNQPGAIAADLGPRDGAPGPDFHVGLFLESSTGFVTGMFGAWAAGMGILPLPTDFPDGRLRVMVADRSPAVLLTSAALSGRAAGLAGAVDPPVPVVLLEDALAEPRSELPPPAGDAPAFTVYTSGTTGIPKGVVIRQDQLAPLLGWSQTTWRTGGWMRVAQTLSLGFDFGLQELFTVVPDGGSLVVPTARDRRDAQTYARFLRRDRVTVLFTTPSFADELVAADVPLPDLRLILLGGEVLRRHTVIGLRRLLDPACRLFNGYGPTEATVNCLMYEIEQPDQELPPVLPVGRASSAARIRLVDESDIPVPVGAQGQILIGGVGVSDGYLNKPVQSAERFVADPVDAGAGPVYRSGDLAYLRPDGEFVVTGRADRQVKVRGFRVELDEVEAVLRQAPGTTAAVVRVTGEPGRLVAFVTGRDVVAREVLGHAVGSLPPALVPEQFVRLDRLPVTANGKLDEDALRRYAMEAGPVPVPESASPAEIEAAVCQVWAMALSLPDVPAEANVFDIGAHSLIVTRVHSQLETALGVAFPVHDIFEHPRPRDLARRLTVGRVVKPSPNPSQSATSEG